jgi:hypothetical protein
MARDRNDSRPTSRGALLTAVAVSVVVGGFVPFGGVLLYPFTLMATWVHEMGHGLSALAVGGSFLRLEIFADASGLAYHTASLPWQRGVAALGGLLAPPVVGCAVLSFARGPRRAQTVLVTLGVAMLASLPLWVRSVAGFVAVPVVCALLLAFVAWASPRERMFLAQLVGVRLSIDTLTRGLAYTFSDSAMVDGQKRASDIVTVAESFGGPTFLWSVLVSSLSIGFVGVGLVLAWTRTGAWSTSRR